MQQDLTQTRVRRALCPLLEAGLGTETYELAAGSELKDSKSLSEALLLLLFFWFLFHRVYVFKMSSSRLTDKAQTNTEGLDPRMDILSGQIGVCRDGGKSQNVQVILQIQALGNLPLILTLFGCKKVSDS